MKKQSQKATKNHIDKLQKAITIAGIKRNKIRDSLEAKIKTLNAEKAKLNEELIAMDKQPADVTAMQDYLSKVVSAPQSYGFKSVEEIIKFINGETE